MNSIYDTSGNTNILTNAHSFMVAPHYYGVLTCNNSHDPEWKYSKY